MKPVKHTVRSLTASFEYLDALRESGVTNMYASPAYLTRDLNRGRDTAVAEVTLWMKTFSKDAPAVRAKSALSKKAEA